MNLKLIVTGDGSHTLFTDEFNESYHSVHGAIHESMHVYITAAFNRHPDIKISLLEIGFGTGLNTLLTYLEASKSGRKVNYSAIELHPLLPELFTSLNYPEILGFDRQIFNQMHTYRWNQEIKFSDFFTLKKIKADLVTYSFTDKYDVIYFDAFSPETQPELWSFDVILKVSSLLNPGGILTTYSSQGQVRRNMIKAGLKVEKLPGPPHKREMMRAIKQVIIE